MFCRCFHELALLWVPILLFTKNPHESPNADGNVQQSTYVVAFHYKTSPIVEYWECFLLPLAVYKKMV